jgi:predicted lipase
MNPLNLGIVNAAPSPNPREAAICAQASQRAYREITIDAGRAHCLVIEQPDALIIAFRGTANILDALTDAEAWFHPTAAGRVHGGFEASYDAIRLDIQRRALGTLKPIYLTGHSLGGAHAMLAAWDLFHANISPSRLTVYTFGQPRVGDAAFAAAYRAAGLHDRTWRYIHQADVVPRLAGYLLGYRHTGREIFHNLFGATDYACPLWLKLATDAWVNFRAWKSGHLALFDDHHVDNYVSWTRSLDSSPA